MPRRLASIAVSLALLVAISAPVAPVGAVEACDPFLTTPVYDPSVPSSTEVLGFEFGVREFVIDRITDPANPVNEINAVPRRQSTRTATGS